MNQLQGYATTKWSGAKNYFFKPSHRSTISSPLVLSLTGKCKIWKNFLYHYNKTIFVQVVFWSHLVLSWDFISIFLMGNRGQAACLPDGCRRDDCRSAKSVTECHIHSNDIAHSESVILIMHRHAFAQFLVLDANILWTIFVDKAYLVIYNMWKKF